MDATAPNDVTPPPGVVFDLAERAVDFVRRTLGVPLDYTPETLPLLDHYVRSVPKERPELTDLVACAAGAYFGEVLRRQLGGRWDTSAAEPWGWRVVTTLGVTMSPVAFAEEVLLLGPAPEHDGSFEVPEQARPLVEEVLASREVSDEEFYSFSGRIEALEAVADLLAGVAQVAAATPK